MHVYIFVHSTHLHSSPPLLRIRFRIASLTLLTWTNAREKRRFYYSRMTGETRCSARTSNKGLWVVKSLAKYSRKEIYYYTIMQSYAQTTSIFPMYHPSHYYFTCNYWNKIFLKRILGFSSWSPHVHHQTEILSSECCLCMHLERHLQRSIPDSRECTLQVNVAFRGDYITNRSNI